MNDFFFLSRSCLYAEKKKNLLSIFHIMGKENCLYDTRFNSMREVIFVGYCAEKKSIWKNGKFNVAAEENLKIVYYA